MDDYEHIELAEAAQQVDQDYTAVRLAIRAEVALCEKHTHNGVGMGPGDILELPALTAEVLVKAGVAKYL